MAKINVTMYGRTFDAPVTGNLVQTKNTVYEKGERIENYDVTHVINSRTLESAILQAKKAGIKVEGKDLRYAFANVGIPEEMREKGRNFFLAIPAVKKEFDALIAKNEAEAKAKAKAKAKAA